MPLVLHWKATAAMVSGYILVAAAVMLFVRNETAQLVVLFAAFSFILIAGNLFLRFRAASRQKPERRP